MQLTVANTVMPLMSLLPLLLLSTLSRAAPTDVSEASGSGVKGGAEGHYDDVANESELAKRLSSFVRIGRPSSFVRIGRGSNFVRMGKACL